MVEKLRSMKYWGVGDRRKKRILEEKNRSIEFINFYVICYQCLHVSDQEQYGTACIVLFGVAVKEY